MEPNETPVGQMTYFEYEAEILLRFPNLHHVIEPCNCILKDCCGWTHTSYRKDSPSCQPSTTTNPMTT